MQFGVMHFGKAPFTELVRRFQIEESLGFDHGWVDDDLNFPEYSDFEPWTLLAGVARETSRIRLGTLVTVPPFRHPSLLASQIMTVDHISDGRVEIGIGSGSAENQHNAYSQQQWTPIERMDRLSEQIPILDGLLRGDTVSASGPHYPVTDARVSRPVQRPRPPLIIAAHGPRGLRLTAKYADGWNVMAGQSYPPVGDRLPLKEAVANTRRLNEQLDEECRAIGRDPATIRRIVLAYRPATEPFSSVDAFDEYVEMYREIGVSEIVFYWPIVEQAVFGAPMTSDDQSRFERIAAERLPAYQS